MEDKDRLININISTLTILKIVVLAIVLYFLFLVRDILVVLFVALIFASAVNPWVDWMQERKVPRTVGILLIYLALAVIVSSMFYLILPPIMAQLGELSKNFPKYFDKMMSSISIIQGYSSQIKSLDALKSGLETLGSNIQSSAGGVYSTVSGIFGSIFSFFLVLVITFYMVVEENAMKKIVWSTLPVKHQPYVLRLIGRMQHKIGRWLTGQLILCLSVGIITYCGLLIFSMFAGMKYALVLAIIAGMTEFIPYLGPIIGAIPAVFLAFSISPMLAVFIAIFYYFVQFTENNILVPKIMQKAVGLNPIVSITVLLIGFKLAGIAGAILSIPVATATSVLVQDIFDNKVGESEGV